jgi:hypothetical protein
MLLLFKELTFGILISAICTVYIPRELHGYTSVVIALLVTSACEQLQSCK